ncbi:MAG: lactonase family protein, partial [Balneolaceae bacterium]
SLSSSITLLDNPSFIAISPDQQNLYAVSELGSGDEGYGFIYAYSLDNLGNPVFIDRYPTNAFSPCHVSVDATGKFVFVANYQGGVAMVYQRNEDGSLEFIQQLDHKGSGPHPNQNGSHTHMVKVSPDNNFLFIPDLGSDKVWSYRINHEEGTVSKNTQEFIATAPGSGPRHMDFHPTKDIAYVMNELNFTVSVMNYESDSGTLTEYQRIPAIPSDFTAWNSSADIHVHPSGKFLYASNRGHNSIASFSIDEAGMLTPIGHTSTEGGTPRNFNIAPSGDLLFVANQDSDSITIFSIDSETGELTFTGNSLEVPTPVNITFY